LVIASGMSLFVVILLFSERRRKKKEYTRSILNFNGTQKNRSGPLFRNRRKRKWWELT
jgi:hypothetical protein